MEVKIFVNGREIRLKDYPKRVLYNLIEGYVKSLKLEDPPREIEVHVKLKQEDSRDP